MLENENSYTVFGLNEIHDTSVKIPYSYNGKLITSISCDAFKNVNDINFIIFGTNIKNIELGAFDGCDSLQIIYFEGNENEWNNVEGNSIFIEKNVERYFYSSVEPTLVGNYWHYGSDGLSPVIWGDLEYRLINDEYEVAGIGNYKDSNVIIPEEYKGKKVTSIGERAFWCNNHDIIENVFIPSTIKTIGEKAFVGCFNLTSIIIPDSVISIGASAFDGCSKLSSIEISKNLQNLEGPIFNIYNDALVNIKLTLFDDKKINDYFEGFSLTRLEKIEIVITSSVTSIDEGEFENLSSLTSIEIPNSVTSIGERAFSGCSSLTNVVIPESVTSIGKYAFGDCNSLKSITLPFVGDKLENPEHSNFSYIFSGESLKEVIITKATTIGEYAFNGCSSLTNIVIPESVTSIGTSAFRGCSGLTSIEIPNSVTSIGESAFSGCSGLTNVVISESVTSIGEYAFNGCSSLTNIVIPESVTSIGTSAFRGCSGLTSIEIPNSVTSIGESAFSGCSGLTNVVISESVTSIGEYAFNGCSSLTNIVIPESVTSIGKYAFGDCNSLKSITLPFVGDKLENPEHSNFSYIFSDESLKEVIITKATTIGEYAFNGCSSLTNIVIPESVTSIGKYAFGDCNSLKSITLPFVGDKLENPEHSNFSYIFSGESLKEVIITKATTIGETAFAGCNSISSIEIPASVTNIEKNAFEGCTNLTNIKIDKNNKNYDSRNDCNAIIKTNENEIILGCENTIIPDSVISIGDFAFRGCSGLVNIIIPNSVTSIGASAFKDCSGLTSVEIPNSVISIEEFTFSGCSNLTSIEIPKSVTSIGESAFNGCSSLTSIEIPNSVTSIGADSFEECNSLASITLPFIGDKLENPKHSNFGYIFGDHISYSTAIPQSLKDVIITNAIVIGENAFYCCSNLVNIVIPESVTNIGNQAFAYCSGLTSIEIPESVTSIGGSAFKNCSGVVNIIIPDSVASIGTETFSGCSNLISVEIPASVTSIGYRAFENCSALENITIPDSVTRIDGNVFMGCTSLSSVIVDKNNTVYDSRNDCNAIIETSSNYLLTGCLNTIIPESVTSIGDKAFSGCSGLTSIEIPESVTSIGEYSFYNCSSLTNIEIPDSVTYISSNVFSGCNSLVSICLPFIGERLENPSNTSFSYFFETVPTSLKDVEITNGTSIATNSFSGCSSLETIKVPNTITSIGNYAFRGCTNLKDFIIPKSVTKIGSGAFKACTSLTMLYYSSSKEDWHNITKADDIGLSSTTICYYSEEKTEDDSELYWHYDEDGITPVIWIEEND